MSNGVLKSPQISHFWPLRAKNDLVRPYAEHHSLGQGQHQGAILTVIALPTGGDGAARRAEEVDVSGVLAGDGVVKLADFGVSASIADSEWGLGKGIVTLA